MYQGLRNVVTELQNMQDFAPKDWALIIVSSISAIISGIAVYYYKKALKVSQEQVIISQSSSRKESYKVIIDAPKNKYKIASCVENLFTGEMYITTFVNEFLQNKQLGISIEKDDILLSAYVNIIEMNILNQIKLDKILLDIDKYELIVYFGKKTLLYYLEFHKKFEDHEYNYGIENTAMPKLIKYHMLYRNVFEEFHNKVFHNDVD